MNWPWRVANGKYLKPLDAAGRTAGNGDPSARWRKSMTVQRSKNSTSDKRQTSDVYCIFAVNNGVSSLISVGGFQRIRHVGMVHSAYRLAANLMAKHHRRHLVAAISAREEQQSLEQRSLT